MSGAIPVSGTPYTIRSGEYVAEIAGVGATLRTLRHNGRDLVLPFDVDEIRPAMRGALLAPWPNRTAEGRYEFDGETYQLPVNEPETGNAAHGLVTSLHFGCLQQSPDRLVLSSRIEAQPGYPWPVRIDAEFQVTGEGFRQAITATNEGARRAPIGLGAHPYLVVPGYVASASAVDAWRLEVPADDVLLVSPDRLLPLGQARVGEALGGALDFRRPKDIGQTALNHAYTALCSNDPDAPGAVVIRLSGKDGSGVELTLDESSRWVQLYTSDAGPVDTRRNALAVEPMTCPPGALNSGIDLRVLGPGESTTLEWRLRAF